MANSRFPDFRAVVNGTLIRLAEKGVLAADDLNEVNVTILEGLTPKYFCQDDFTVAVLQSQGADNAVVAVGVSKRNPTDRPMVLRGRSLALSRAVKEFVTKVVLPSLNETPYTDTRVARLR